MSAPHAMPPPDENRRLRVRASGIVVHDGRVLLIDCHEDGFGQHYNLPGGGVRYNEPVRDAVRREMREETGLEVEVGPLIMVVEALHEDATRPEDEFHGLSLLFACTPVTDGASAPTGPDTFQTGLAWVPFDDLLAIRLLPDVGAELRAVLLEAPGAVRFCRHARIPRPDPGVV
jgi:8-oxo-dGTP diphosphatase